MSIKKLLLNGHQLKLGSNSLAFETDVFVTSNQPVPIGLFPGGFDSSIVAGTNAQWDGFVSAIGRVPTVVLTYVDQNQPASTWASYASYMAGTLLADTRTSSCIPAIGWGLGSVPDGNLFTQIAAGNYDNQITGALANWHAAGFNTLYIRVGWEMNLGFPWAVTSSNASNYVAAFRHFYTTAHTYAAANGMVVSIVWNPNVANNQNDNTTVLSSYYPGGAFCDMLGIDEYSSPIDTGWASHSPTATTTDPKIFLTNTMIDMAVRDNKPICYGEVGGTDTAFATAVITALNARPSSVKIAFIGFWDPNDNTSFTNPGDNRSALASIWRSGFGPGGSVTTL